MVLGLTSPSSALENSSAIEQIGSGNDARVDQRGTAINMSAITQNGSGNLANVDQHSTNFTDQNKNTSFVEQVGTGHKVNVSQGGAGNVNEFHIYLEGNSSTVQIKQYEQFNERNYTEVEVTGGHSNTVSVTQGGTGNLSWSSIVMTGQQQQCLGLQHQSNTDTRTLRHNG